MSDTYPQAQTKKKIEVMQHYADGGKVECRQINSTGVTWSKINSPMWNWTHYEYRIRQEPKKVYVGIVKNDEHVLPYLYVTTPPFNTSEEVYELYDDVLHVVCIEEEPE